MRVFDVNSPFIFYRWRYRGSKVLRSKYVLLMIVLLNIVDCALVLGELVLDLNHVKSRSTVRHK